jgi:hypothetical protein
LKSLKTLVLFVTLFSQNSCQEKSGLNVEMVKIVWYLA